MTFLANLNWTALRRYAQFFREERAAHPQFVDITMTLIREVLPWLFEPAHDGEPAGICKRINTSQFIHRANRA